MKLAPSSKLDIGTYTADKINVIGSCTLLAVHPDTQCLKEVTFHVTSHEGSVVLFCATTLDLCLIQPHSNLDSFPFSASLITGKADYSRKTKSQKNMSVLRPKKNMCSNKEQPPKIYLHKDIQLISVLYNKINKNQASRSANQMLFLWMTGTVNLLCALTRTVRIPCLFICGQQ